MPVNSKDRKWYPRVAANAGELYEFQLEQTLARRRKKRSAALGIEPQRATLEHMEKDDVIRTRAPLALKLAHEKCAEMDDRSQSDYLRKLIKDDVVAKLGPDWEEKMKKELKAKKK